MTLPAAARPPERSDPSMALTITPLCVNCYACLDVCPNQAVIEAQPHFVIELSACDECNGHFADSQCAAICPVEAAILDGAGVPINPPGSLTGIPPERRAALTVAVSP
jgi:ferredoxin